MLPIPTRCGTLNELLQAGEAPGPTDSRWPNQFVVPEGGLREGQVLYVVITAGVICNPVLDCIEDQRCGRGVAAAPVPGRWYDLSVQMAQLAQDPVVYVRVEVPADVSAGLVLGLTVTLATSGDGSGANEGTLIFNPAGPFEFRKPPPFASVATKSIDQVMLMNARQTYPVPGVDRSVTSRRTS